jgi:RND family efflux transporter MFP subunit
MLHNYQTPPWVSTGQGLSKAVSLAALGLLLTIAGCEMPQDAAKAQSELASDQFEEVTAVETAIAQTGSLQEVIEYTGTTQPFRQVSLRSQVEGRLVNLTVDVGDAVRQGQLLAQLDDQLLRTEVNQAQAQLAALDAEVAQAQAEVSAAQAEVEQARVEQQQLQADAKRLQSLSKEGAIAQQQAEQAQTAANAAAQRVRSAEKQVRTRQQAVVAARRRVIAQNAVVAQSEERRTYSQVTSPITGVVLERVTEPGNLVQPGNEILKLGDFSAIKVIVQVSELELSNIQVRQTTQVRLDAFPEQVFIGEVSRISPAADPTSRLVPVEVKIPNSGERIGSGLLARVQFEPRDAATVVISETALQAGEGDNESTLFVVSGEGESAKAVPRSVRIGAKAKGKVEILSGLQPGEAFIVKSSKPLQEDQAVRLSILSETSP